MPKEIGPRERQLREVRERNYEIAQREARERNMAEAKAISPVKVQALRDKVASIKPKPKKAKKGIRK